MDAALLREAKAIRRRMEELSDRLDDLQERIERGNDAPAKPKRKKNDADPFDQGEGDDGEADGDSDKP